MVNYRANIWALHAQNVTHVVSVASVGGIRADLGPGVIAVPASDHRLHLGAQVAPSTRATSAVWCTSISPTRIAKRCASAAWRRPARRRGGGGRRRVRGHPGTAARDGRRDRSPGARRRGHGRHDRHAGGRAGARAGPVLRSDRGGGQLRRRARAAAAKASAWKTSTPPCRPRSRKVRGIIEKLAEHPWRLDRCCAWATRACWSAARRGGAVRHAGAARAAAGHARHHGGAERRRPGGAADRRAAARGDLRRGAQSALSGCRAGALHGADQPGDHAPGRGDGGGLGRLPERAGHARPGAALRAAALSRRTTSTARPSIAA